MDADARRYEAWNVGLIYCVRILVDPRCAADQSRRLDDVGRLPSSSTKSTSQAKGEMPERPLTRQQVEVQQAGAGLLVCLWRVLSGARWRGASCASRVSCRHHRRGKKEGRDSTLCWLEEEEIVIYSRWGVDIYGADAGRLDELLPNSLEGSRRGRTMT